MQIITKTRLLVLELSQYVKTENIYSCYYCTKENIISSYFGELQDLFLCKLQSYFGEVHPENLVLYDVQLS